MLVEKYLGVNNWWTRARDRSQIGIGRWTKSGCRRRCRVMQTGIALSGSGGYSVQTFRPAGSVSTRTIEAMIWLFWM